MWFPFLTPASSFSCGLLPFSFFFFIIFIVCAVAGYGLLYYVWVGDDDRHQYENDYKKICVDMYGLKLVLKMALSSKKNNNNRKASKSEHDGIMY